MPPSNYTAAPVLRRLLRIPPSSSRRPSSAMRRWRLCYVRGASVVDGVGWVLDFLPVSGCGVRSASVRAGVAAAKAQHASCCRMGGQRPGQGG